MRMPMARSVMRLGPVHVVVVAPSAPLRASLVSWLRVNKRVRIVRSVGSAAELDGHRIDCDLVVASALEGTRELRTLARRFRAHAGLAALTLGTAPLPTGWAPIRPGASRDHVLDHAVPHPERTLAGSWTAISAAIVALVAVLVAFVYVPETGASFQRAALAYASRYPDAGTWWHTWGAGAPSLAAASWPLLKVAALTRGGPEVFAQLASAVGALYGVSFVLLAARAGPARYALVAGLAVMVPPAIWVWPRGGDASSLAGLAGVVLALGSTHAGRLRLTATALAVAVSSFGGYLWVASAAVAAIVVGVRARRGPATVAGAALGVLMSTAVALPPILSRGIEGLRPPLLRPMAVSDVVPVVASAALLAVILVRGRLRRVLIGTAVVAFVAANAIAFAVPPQEVEVRNVPSTGAFGRLAVHPTQALALLARTPDLPVSGDEIAPSVILGEDTKEATNARLEWLGADRAMLPDRSSAIIFNERDWSLIDRDRLLFGAPRVRPILTAGITPTILVVADEPDARAFGEALLRLGAQSDRLIPVRSERSLDELDRDTLRQFTMVAIYGQPWKDIKKAEILLSDYFEQNGFVFWDAAGRAGDQPLLGEARTVRGEGDDVSATGEPALITALRGFGGRVVAMDKYVFASDPAWERAALSASNKRLIEFGQLSVGGLGSAHLVWSGVDLPGRVTSGDDTALAQFRQALTWELGAAGVEITGGYGSPEGDVLDNETGTSRFLGPAHWRIEMKVGTNGVLFKERYHPQWRAFQVDIMPLTQAEARTPLRIFPTAHGYMYVALPSNARTVDFVFERHPYESTARGVSGIALFLTLASSFFLGRRR